MKANRDDHAQPTLSRKRIIVQVVASMLFLRFFLSVMRMQMVLEENSEVVSVTETISFASEPEQRHLAVKKEEARQAKVAPPLPLVEEEVDEPFKIVDTTTWAKPSESYQVNTMDLWEDHDLPQWMVDYFRWHKEQISGDWATSSESLPDNRYLYVTCLKDYPKCGGTADRLLSLPFFVKVAASAKRVLLIQWTKPAALEEFLLPPVSGVDWRVPKAKEGALRDVGVKAGNQDTIVGMAPFSNTTVLQVKFQSHDHGSKHYNSIRETENEPSFRRIFHAVWRVFFTPTPAVAVKIDALMQQQGLYPGEYTSAHLRALYGVQSRDDRMVEEWSRNAVHCAIQLQRQPRDPLPVFFAADSDRALRHAMQYGSSNGLPVVTSKRIFDCLWILCIWIEPTTGVRGWRLN